MKRKIYLAVIFVIVAWATMATVANAGTYGDLTYEISNNEITITDCSTSATSVVIPETIEDLPVKKISESAFSGCARLTSVIIPDNVRLIGNSAFYNCTRLKSLTIGNYVRGIGTAAFSGCASLTSVTIPDSVTSIGSSAFSGCTNLTSVTIGNRVTSIGHSAFKSCTSLTSITIPDNVTSIGESALSGCTSITSVTIGKGVTSTGDSTFSGCTSLTSITIPDNVTSIGESAFSGCTSLTSVTIGKGVTSTGDSTFSGCTSLTSITIPDNVTSIGESAFSGCTSLTSITIPDSVTSIGSSAFSGCTSLGSIIIPQSLTSVDRGVFRKCVSLTSISIPDNVTSIGSSAFYWCTSLTSVTIPDSVTSIGSSAFGYCTSLESVTIPDNVTSIGERMFYNCTSLTRVTIPDNVTSIGESAFSGCTSLTRVTIPDNVMSIGEDAFSGCTSLESVYITDLAAYLNISYGNAYSTPMCCADKLYLNDEPVTDLVIPAGVEQIPMYAFYGCTSLTSVTIPDSVTSIGSSAFRNCSGLTSITIPDSITSIGNYTFYNQLSPNVIFYTGTEAQWAEVTDGKTVTGGRVFCSGTYKTEFAADGTWYYSDVEIIRYEGNAAAVTIPAELGGQKITTLSDCALRGNTAIKAVTIPEEIMTISTTAFGLCSNLQDVYIQDAKEFVTYSYASCFADAEVHFAYISYSVTYNYNANGGTASTAKATRLREDRNTADLTPIATKADWEFVGWNTDQNATEGLTTLSIKKNTTLYAIFKRTIPVAFYAGENVLVENEERTVFNLGTAVNFPAIPEIEGWTAQGWRIDTAADAPMYTEASVMLAEGATFYAVYSREITLSYDAAGGESTPESVTKTQYRNASGNQQEFTLTIAPAISRTDFLFSHWAKGSAGGEPYAPEKSITIAEDTKMYAVWKLIPVSGITLDKSMIMTKTGMSEKLTAQISPANAGNKTILWTTSDASVAEMGNDGSLTINGVGNALITATTEDGGLTASCEVVVFSFSGEFLDYGKDANGIYWAINDSGIFEMVGVGSTADYAKISEIPWYSIKENIKTIVVDERINRIGDRNFYGCVNAEKAEIPVGVTAIGTLAFGNCEKIAIHCEADSYAETYAKDNEITYVILQPFFIIEKSADDSFLHFKALLENYSKDARIMLGLYDEKGKLLDLLFENITDNEAASFKQAKTAKISYVQFFAWEGQNMRPICKREKIEV